ncbi:MAG: sulfatase-like hydrolase/transferase [Bacillota bacterium]|nr:sulfatase-like hydrolase/transferase [Bacillota bacterium]
MRINCADLGCGNPGCYGSRVNRTPTVSRMAAKGLRLTDFYMVSPLCSSWRGAMPPGSQAPRSGFGSFDSDSVLFPGHDLSQLPGKTRFIHEQRETFFVFYPPGCMSIRPAMCRSTSKGNRETVSPATVSRCWTGRRPEACPASRATHRQRRESSLRHRALRSFLVRSLKAGLFRCQHTVDGGGAGDRYIRSAIKIPALGCASRPRAAWTRPERKFRSYAAVQLGEKSRQRRQNGQTGQGGRTIM